MKVTKKSIVRFFGVLSMLPPFFPTHSIAFYHQKKNYANSE